MALTIVGFLGAGQTAQAQSGFSLGNEANFVLLDEGYGTNTLSFGAGTIDGNIGIGDPGSGSTSLSFASGAYVNGTIDFAGSEGSVNGTSAGNATIQSGITAVQTDLLYLNNLSTTLAAESTSNEGTALTVNLSANQSQTINANSGHLEASGNKVFTVDAFTFSAGSTLTINGDGLGQLRISAPQKRGELFVLFSSPRMPGRVGHSIALKTTVGVNWMNVLNIAAGVASLTGWTNLPF